jgi:hypothetical protein
MRFLLKFHLIALMIQLFFYINGILNGYLPAILWGTIGCIYELICVFYYSN